MKYYVLYDQQGKIVALTPAVTREPNRGGVGSQPQPTAEHKAAELEVPEEHVNLPLRELLERLEADTSGERPTLRSRRSA
jgi:hypothetical protein